MLPPILPKTHALGNLPFPSSPILPRACFLSLPSFLTPREPAWTRLPLPRPPRVLACLGPSRCQPCSTGSCSLRCPLQDLRTHSCRVGAHFPLFSAGLRPLGSEERGHTAHTTHLGSRHAHARCPPAASVAGSVQAAVSTFQPIGFSPFSLGKGSHFQRRPELTTRK